MDTLIIQCPLVQLNTPYPSGAYLSAFFKDEYKKRNINGTIVWQDLSTQLFHSIFCKEGIKQLFEITHDSALMMAESFEKSGDENSAFQIRRYISQAQLWTDWIDIIKAIVSPKGATDNIHFYGREYAHEFVRSAHAPRGMRMEQFLQKLNRDPCVDDASILATLAIADLADYITSVFDKNFSLIRYAESVCSSANSLSEIEQTLNAPILVNYYQELLEKTCKKFIKPQNKTLVCISVPFGGTISSALFTCQFLKKKYGNKVFISLGGGFVNTELRSIHDVNLFKYIDSISYDRGYGSYISLFDKAIKNGTDKNDYDLFLALDGESLYKLSYTKNNKLVYGYSIDETDTIKKSDYEVNECQKNKVNYFLKENEIAQSIVPDYSDIDFSSYPRLADTINPMQRIWSDGAWLKAYLAYGCYWHRCSFCDTTLEYVKEYCLGNTKLLFNGLVEQAYKAKVRGIHFVDEACPPKALQKFALLNCTQKMNINRFTFWGNIRFEKTFSRDVADVLSYGGLTGVSAGIEIATSNGLESINKGTNLENIVSACCAFKEAGILVHSYMIYGFYNQNEQDIIDSLETLRQFFAAGLIDSAFFHQFTLTKHSTIYKEWLEGKHPNLHPVEPNKKSFAENTLHFEGEKKYTKYADGLNIALENWMSGRGVNKPVQTWFNFKMPKPKVDSNLIEQLIAKYEVKTEMERNQPIEKNKRYVWLGGKVINQQNQNSSTLSWAWMGNIESVKIMHDVLNLNQINKLIQILEVSRPENSNGEGIYGSDLCELIQHNLYVHLRSCGLVKLLYTRL